MDSFVSQVVKPKQKRLAVRLSASLEKNLLAYAAAATAAGMGIGAQPAEAKIVYTKADIPINLGTVYLDLNHDGINDFYLYDTSRGDSDTWSAYLNVWASQAGNGIWSNKTSSFCNPGRCAAALPKGTKVGPKAPFADGGLMASYGYSRGRGSFQFGPWLKVQQAYLGFKFVIKGKVHYGWARVKMLSQKHPYRAEITGYAYETIPNKPIKTGATKGPDDASMGRWPQAQLGLRLGDDEEGEGTNLHRENQA